MADSSTSGGALRATAAGGAIRRSDESDLGTLPAQRKFPVIRRFMRNKLAVVGLIVIVILYGLAIIGPLISPYPYDQINAGMRDKPPSAEHWLGTDRSSRDTLSRLLKGGHKSRPRPGSRRWRW